MVIRHSSKILNCTWFLSKCTHGDRCLKENFIDLIMQIIYSEFHLTSKDFRISAYVFHLKTILNFSPCS